MAFLSKKREVAKKEKAEKKDPDDDILDDDEVIGGANEKLAESLLSSSEDEELRGNKARSKKKQPKSRAQALKEPPLSKDLPQEVKLLGHLETKATAAAAPTISEKQPELLDKDVEKHSKAAAETPKVQPSKAPNDDIVQVESLKPAIPAEPCNKSISAEPTPSVVTSEPAKAAARADPEKIVATIPVEKPVKPPTELSSDRLVKPSAEQAEKKLSDVEVAPSVASVKEKEPEVEVAGKDSLEKKDDEDKIENEESSVANAKTEDQSSKMTPQKKQPEISASAATTAVKTPAKESSTKQQSEYENMGYVSGDDAATYSMDMNYAAAAAAATKEVANPKEQQAIIAKEVANDESVAKDKNLSLNPACDIKQKAEDSFSVTKNEGKVSEVCATMAPQQQQQVDNDTQMAEQSIFQQQTASSYAVATAVQDCAMNQEAINSNQQQLQQQMTAAVQQQQQQHQPQQLLPSSCALEGKQQ